MYMELLGNSSYKDSIWKPRSNGLFVAPVNMMLLLDERFTVYLVSTTPEFIFVQLKYLHNTFTVAVAAVDIVPTYTA